MTEVRTAGLVKSGMEVSRGTGSLNGLGLLTGKEVSKAAAKNLQMALHINLDRNLGSLSPHAEGSGREFKGPDGQVVGDGGGLTLELFLYDLHRARDEALEPLLDSGADRRVLDLGGPLREPRLEGIRAHHLGDPG